MAHFVLPFAPRYGYETQKRGTVSMNRAPRSTGEVRLFASNETDDSYLNRLVKYVPVEGLAPFIPVAAMAGDKDMQLWITFLATLLVGVVLIAAQTKNQTPRPRLWFWPFVVIAFVAWSVGASEEFRGLLEVSSESGGWFLALVAVVLPALDLGLETLFPPK